MIIDNTWARLVPNPEFGDLPGIFATKLEWDLRGQPPPAGLLPVRHARAARRRVEIPHLQRMGLDIGQGRDVRLLRAEEGKFRPVEAVDADVLVEAEFPSDHPLEWVQQLAAAGLAVLAIADSGPDSFATMGEWTDTWSVGVVSVMTYLSDTGAGVVPNW